MNNDTTTQNTDNTPTGTLGMVLGIVTMLLWIIPIIGIPLSIWGLVSSIKAKGKGAQGRATTGMVLCIIALVLGICNAAIGAYMGATGQHALFN